MGIKLIATDIDGTLIDQTEKIPDRLVETVQRCQEKGIYFVLATGRTRELVADIVKTLGIAGPYVIANGACIFRGSECIYSRGFLAEPILGLIKEADAEGLTVTFSDNYMERAVRETAYVKEHQKMGNRFLQPISLTETDWGRQQFQKIMILDEHRTGKIQKYQNRMREYQTEYSVTTYSDMAVELGPKGCNKATGLKHLAGMLQLDMKDIMACGDFTNDLEMIREAGIGVAVANASEALKQEADYVAKREYCYGVIEAIETYCF